MLLKIIHAAPNFPSGPYSTRLEPNLVACLSLAAVKLYDISLSLLTHRFEYVRISSQFGSALFFKLLSLFTKCFKVHSRSNHNQIMINCIPKQWIITVMPQL